jgi:hypothetical protein
MNRRTPGIPIFRACLVALAAVVLVTAWGCADQGIKKVTVSGTVSHKGQRLQSGMLQFIGPQGAYSAAAIQADGTYIITDVVPGEVKVGVLESPQGSGSSSGADTSAVQRAAPVSLPEKYRDPEKSGVTYTITESTTQLNIELP